MKKSIMFIAGTMWTHATFILLKRTHVYGHIVHVSWPTVLSMSKLCEESF